MASALSSSFSETTIYLPDNVLLSPTDGEVHGIFPESACIEEEVVAEELERVRTTK
jgi:hypothetical protein